MDHLVRRAQDTRAAIERLRSDTEPCPEHFAPAVLNEALLLLLENQAAILEGLAALEAGGKESAPGKLDSVEDESIGSEEDLELIEEDVEAVAVSEHQALVAVRAFDQRDGDFERGLKQLNAWVSGVTGTPFQLRKKEHLAYLNVSGLAQEKIREREEFLNRFTGYERCLGRLVHERLVGEVLLYGP